MAVYSNSTDSAVFDKQCESCKFGDKPCPVAQAQLGYNYSQHDSYIAKQILETIVSTKDGCEMMHRFKEELFVHDPDQCGLF